MRNPISIGSRVELHPATDDWMRGDRYGEVIGYGRARLYIDTFTKETSMQRPCRVKLDKSGLIKRHHPDTLCVIS